MHQIPLLIVELIKSNSINLFLNGRELIQWFKGKFISYVKSKKMISKGCIYDVIWVRDVEFNVPTLDLIPIVNEFFDVFFNDLPNIPLEREIYFGIDLLPDIQPIVIPSY